MHTSTGKSLCLCGASLEGSWVFADHISMIFYVHFASPGRDGQISPLQIYDVKVFIWSFHNQSPRSKKTRPWSEILDQFWGMTKQARPQDPREVAQSWQEAGANGFVFFLVISVALYRFGSLPQNGNHDCKSDPEKGDLSKPNVVKTIFFCMFFLWFVGVCRNSQLHIPIELCLWCLIFYDNFAFWLHVSGEVHAFCRHIVGRFGCRLSPWLVHEPPPKPPTIKISQTWTLMPDVATKSLGNDRVTQIFEVEEVWGGMKWRLQKVVSKIQKNHSQNYFTSSDPHHDMLGGGCQVRVVIENMMGRMENLRTLISGFLGLVILVRWALVTMFLSWTTQTGCRIHRTYVSLIGSGEGRHTTHLLKCVPLLSTSQTDWKQSSDVLSDISFDILSDISSDIFFWHIFWHSFWHIFWHSFSHLSDISSDIFFWHIFWHSFWHIFWHSFWHLSDISFDILSDKSFDTLSDISSDISFHMLSDISKPKPNIHSFTQKAALQTLYLPHTTQQK